MRDPLARLVADRLDVPVEYVTARSPAPRIAPRARPGSSSGRPGIGTALAAERAFLALCARSGELGRGYLRALTEDHLSSETSRRARKHLLSHFDDPLAELPEDDPA